MAMVRRHLTEVLSKGRPSRQAIEASVIGALGFSTWRGLLEAPVDQGGLALSWSTWRAVVPGLGGSRRTPSTP